MIPLLPRWAWGLIGSGALILAGLAWLHFHDRATIAAHEADVATRMQKRADKAEADAVSAVTKTSNEVEQGNEQARNAAARGSDPLGDGMRSLRGTKRPARPATR